MYQRNKTDTLSPTRLLQPLLIPCQVWDDITMDFIEGLPCSNCKSIILIIVDRLSKAAHFLALSHPITAKMVSEISIDWVVKLHGMPRSIINDWDPIFLSHFWKEFFKISSTQLKISSSYHPQTDGQSKVVNRCIEQYLWCFVSHPKQMEFIPSLSWVSVQYDLSSPRPLF